MAINKIKVTKKKIKIKTKAKASSTSSSKSSSKSTGNIVNINVPQPKKRPYTRRQPSKTSQPSSTTSVVTQIHQMPIPHMIMSEMLGTNNLKSAQLSGDLGIIRNNEINNQSAFSIGGNQDRKILTSADRADALMTSIASKQPANLLGILNEQDNIPVPSMKERPMRKLSPQRELFKPIEIPRKTFIQLEKEAKEKGLNEPGTSSLFNYLIPKDLKKLRKTKTGDTSIFEPSDSVEDHRKETNKNEDALYGYKKDGTPKKKTGRKIKLD